MCFPRPVKAGLDQRLPARRLGVKLLDCPAGIFDRTDHVESFFGLCSEADMGCVSLPNFGAGLFSCIDDAVVEVIENHADRRLSSDLGLESGDRLDGNQLALNQDSNTIGKADCRVDAVG